MWRAYGGNSGVAIIFKHDLFENLIKKSGLDFSSVAYLKDSQLKKRNSKSWKVCLLKY